MEEVDLSSSRHYIETVLILEFCYEFILVNSFLILPGRVNIYILSHWYVICLISEVSDLIGEVMT